MCLMVTAAGLILAILAFFTWMARDILAQSPEKLLNAVQPLVELGRLLQQVVLRATQVTSAFFETLHCYVFIYFWLVRYRVRNQIARYTTVVFLCAGGFGMLEKLMNLLNFQLVSGVLQRHEHLERAKVVVEHLLTDPLTLILLVFIEVLLIRHHSREPAHHHHERTTLAALQQVLLPLSKLNTQLGRPEITADEADSLRESYWDILSTGMKRLFKERRVADLNISIMRLKGAEEGTERRLKIVWENDRPHRCDHNFTLLPGEGAAGIGFQRKHAVFIPVIRYRHAIALIQEPGMDSIQMRVLLDVYKPSTHPFKSMLSVPIILNDTEVAGVVNLSSARKSAFKGSDFNVAYLIAAVLGLMNRQDL